jgi:hypothetical protein
MLRVEGGVADAELLAVCEVAPGELRAPFAGELRVALSTWT